MGLFGKKEQCPVCGEDVKGMFLTKIGDKKTLCKTCSKRISMNKELLKTATPEFVQEHLAYREKNAEKYAALRWDIQYTDIKSLTFGADPGAGFFYLVHSDLHDEDNPVVFSFNQITGYELYRNAKKIDDADTPGETPLESTFSMVTGIANLAKKDGEANYEKFKLKLTTTDPYWPELLIEIVFTDAQLYGWDGCIGFDGQLKAICQLFKHIVRKEPVNIV